MALMIDLENKFIIGTTTPRDIKIFGLIEASLIGD
jgi:hypothetical protein